MAEAETTTQTQTDAGQTQATTQQTQGAATATTGGDGGSAGQQQTKAVETDWRAGIKDPDARKFAESSPDPEHLTKRALEMRQKLSAAIIRPGKDAKPEEVAAYRKAMEIPDAPDGYKFEMPKGVEATDGDKAFHAEVSKVFHDADITATQAKKLNAWLNDFSARAQQAEVEADKTFAQQTEQALRQKWPGAEYDKNKTFAGRALEKFGAANADELRNLKLEGGRFLLDHPLILEMLAPIGRWDSEDGERFGAPMSDGDRNSLEQQKGELQKKLDAALGRNDTAEAQRIDSELLALNKKLGGNRPIVGTQSRAA